MTIKVPTARRVVTCAAGLLLTAGVCWSQGMPVAKHLFQPPQRQWLEEVDYLQEDGTDSFLVVKPADRDPGIKTYHKEINYYRNGHDLAAERACKILRYSPRGWREEEIDNIGPDQYSREFYANGSVSSCLHWYGPGGYFGKWLDGDSISPIKKTVSHFDHGRGALTVWDNGTGDEGTYTRTWYLDGDAYLAKRVAQNTPIETTLYAPHDDSLRVGPQEETLTLTSLDEIWTKRRGRPPYAQILDQFDLTTRKGVPSDATHDPVKQRIRQAWPWPPVIYNGPEPFHIKQSRQTADGDARRSALLLELAQDYTARRAAFLAAYGRQLPKAGQSWQSLGLENILEGMP